MQNSNILAQLTLSVFAMMNFSASPDPIFLIKDSRCQIKAQNILNIAVQKLFLYSFYILLKIGAVKNMYFSFPVTSWP